MDGTNHAIVLVLFVLAALTIIVTFAASHMP